MAGLLTEFRNLRGLALLACLSVVSACGASPAVRTVPGEVGLEQARGHVDPTGDAFGPPTNYDITKITVERRTGEVFVTIAFVQNVLLPPPGSGPNNTQLAGFVQLDTDQNPATSGTNQVSSYCPALSGIGPEFFVDLLTTRLANGNYQVSDSTTGSPTGQATPVLLRPNVLGLRIPLAAIGGDDGRADVDMVLGNLAAPTDCAPDNGGFVRPMRARTDSGWVR